MKLDYMSLQAITTKYLGPTNVRGSRIKAKCQAGSVTLHTDHALNPEDNHIAAAKALATKLGWAANWYIGGTADGYVFVQAPHSRPAPVFVTT